MSSGLFTPSNQVKLTNVSVVRLKKGGKRFELACYPNKVSEFRRKVTTRLDEILQAEAIFTNVSKGSVAPKADLMKAFGPNATSKDIILEILNKGELQLSEKERAVGIDNLLTEVSQLISSKTLNPQTKTPYSASMISKAINELGYSLTLTKSAKQHALEIIRQLKASKLLPIERAMMRVHVVYPLSASSKIHDRLIEHFSVIEKDAPVSVHAGGVDSAAEDEEEHEINGLIEPGSYKMLSDLIGSHTKGRGTVVILSMKEMPTD